MARSSRRQRPVPERATARGGPRFPHVFAATWRDGLFCHWPVEPAALEPHVPEPLTLDTRDGQAWLSVVPFVLARAGIRGTPGFARLTVPELNVRTYVRYRGDAGLYFFSVDVDSPTVARVVRRTTRLPCHYATMHVSRVDDEVSFASSRQTPPRDPSTPPARFAATYRADGDVFYPDPGSLAGWLTERRRFYAPGGGRLARRGGRERGEGESNGSDGAPGVLTGEIAHAPWPLRPASVDVQRDTTRAVLGLPDHDDEPVAHVCEELSMTASVLRRL